MTFKKLNFSRVIEQYRAYLLTYCSCCKQGDYRCKNAEDHLGIITYYIAKNTSDSDKKIIQQDCEEIPAN